MKYTGPITAALFAATLALPLSASAADLGAANNFNAFIFNNATASGGHADGAVAVGGDWTNMGYTVTQQALEPTLGTDTKIGIYLKGNLSLSGTATANSSSNVYVQGTVNKNGNNFNLNGGSLFNQPLSDPGVFASQLTYSSAQANYLSSLTGSSINMSDPNNWSINGGNLNNALEVFNVAGSQLGNNVTLNLSNFSASDTLLLNVTGGGNINYNVQVNGFSDSKILWNFGKASTIKINRQFDGSLLGYDATVNQYANIQGTLIANNWNVYNSTEIHFGNGLTFTGNVPPPPAVPEASSVFGLASLLTVCGVGIRRKRHTA